MEPMTYDEVLDRLDEIESEESPGSAEHDALCWMRDVFYLAAEGFIELEGQYCFPGGDHA